MKNLNNYHYRFLFTVLFFLSFNYESAFSQTDPRQYDYLLIHGIRSSGNVWNGSGSTGYDESNHTVWFQFYVENTSNLLIQLDVDIVSGVCTNSSGRIASMFPIEVGGTASAIRRPITNDKPFIDEFTSSTLQYFNQIEIADNARSIETRYKVLSAPTDATIKVYSRFTDDPTDSDNVWKHTLANSDEIIETVALPPNEKFIIGTECELTGQQVAEGEVKCKIDYDDEIPSILDIYASLESDNTESDIGSNILVKSPESTYDFIVHAFDVEDGANTEIQTIEYRIYKYGEEPPAYKTAFNGTQTGEHSYAGTDPNNHDFKYILTNDNQGTDDGTFDISSYADATTIIVQVKVTDIVGRSKEHEENFFVEYIDNVEPELSMWFAFENDGSERAIKLYERSIGTISGNDEVYLAPEANLDLIVDTYDKTSTTSEKSQPAKIIVDVDFHYQLTSSSGLAIKSLEYYEIDINNISHQEFFANGHDESNKKYRYIVSNVRNNNSLTVDDANTFENYWDYTLSPINAYIKYHITVEDVAGNSESKTMYLARMEMDWPPSDYDYQYAKPLLHESLLSMKPALPRQTPKQVQIVGMIFEFILRTRIMMWL